MKLHIAGHDAFAYSGGRLFVAGQPSVVFVHGAANDHSVWALQSRYFAHHGWNVLALDLPGHGQSEGPLRASIGELASWVAAVLDALAVRDAYVIGHSMGSLAALELAATRPELVARLALVGTAVPMAVGDALLAAAADDEERARRMIIDWSFAPASHIGNANAVPGFWLPGNALALMRRMARGVLHNDLAACRHYTEGLTRAASVAAPTLVLCGGRDLMTPPKAAQGALSALRHARAETLPDAGHSMMQEAPAAVLNALWRFAHAA